MTILLLTRPRLDSERFLDAVTNDYGPIKSVISPVMEIIPLEVSLPDCDEVILTSANGARQAARLGVPHGTRAWCVGNRTAQVAKQAGLDPISAGKDADALVNLISSEQTRRLCHLRGTHARGDVAQRLTQLGKNCAEAICYDQRACPPDPDALDAVSGTDPVVLPLFSPRSAVLIPAIVNAPVHAIAMSHAVAAELADLGVDTVVVADRPDFDSMVAATCRRLFAL
ncbi:hypothetical protein BVC71_07800 [Marivivens niveibacter]|uniref:Tetrapyrrole biosynthesis uroporphyrinogen III synthase domain-containing protein n=1 Tax=Marivivens niveibacter TaxID=1930667 RepID=A0A251X018_9RHOB|nr:uroporphyrinogen-III synthase [Marivivens niveibacter]OUD09728.1 hypothetical protein BVC71_07800 [Marivivens niveibacter]